MAVSRDWRTLLTGIPILGVILILSVSSRFGTEQRRSSQAAAADRVAQRSFEDSAQEHRQDPADPLRHYAAMPAFADLQLALRQWARARSDTAAQAGPAPTAPAKQEPQEEMSPEADQAVRDAVERLRLRVPPDVFPQLMEVLSDRQGREHARLGLPRGPESLLGRNP